MLFDDKSIFRLSLRMFTGFVQSLIHLSWLSWTAPNISDIRIPHFADEKSRLILRLAIKKSRDGLHLLVDSTGLKFLGEGEWKRKKNQPEYRRQWPRCIVLDY